MSDIYKTEKKQYPLLALRGLWAFPGIVLHIDCSREISKTAVDVSLQEAGEILLINQKDVFEENPNRDGLYDYGTIATIKQTFNLQNGELRLLVEAKNLAKLEDLSIEDGYYKGLVEEYIFDIENYKKTDKVRSLEKLLISDFREYAIYDSQIPQEFATGLEEIDDPLRIANIITYYLDLRPREFYDLLKELDVEKKLMNLHKILLEEIDIKQTWREIDEEVNKNIDNSQKEYFLREKLSAIKKRLQETTGQEVSEADRYKNEIKKLKISKEDKESLIKDVERLEAIPEMSPDYGVISAYLDFTLNLPWSKKSKDRLDLKKAQDVLDEDHYGLEEVKERVLESIAVRKKKNTSQSSVICLVGPPGVGKTSIAKSIAKALNRKFVSMRLGGVTDESEIRGHRRTYVGAMSGRIISNLNRIGVKNPVFLLDEIDKLGSDFRGDPSSALLEVLDPEQNDKFIDRYLDISFDLSDIFFITTANDANQIPEALYDRLEIITISGYTMGEKEKIASRYLISKEKKANGLEEDELKISDSVIETIIKNYTREAGVRNLERHIARICRRAVKEILTGKKSVSVTMNNYKKYLGKPRYFEDVRSKEDKVGVVNGLAWTQVGGTMLSIEANIMDGKGNIEFTGSLGDVMKESGHVAFSYIRSNSKRLGINSDFYKNKDIHIHVPEGATPKDGPSAGVTMTTAMASILLNKKVRKDIAMTGEVTITGNVLPIGGLKEKALAAYSYGIKDVIIPKDNSRDIEDIPEEIRKKINFIEVSNVSEVLDKALI